MDSKAFYSIDFLFSTFIILTIGILILSYSSNNIESVTQIEENMDLRLLLNNISNSLNQINSENKGYSKIIYLPSKPSYLIKISHTKILIEYKNKKGLSNIIPINLVDLEGNKIKEKTLYPGNYYKFSKLDDDEFQIKEVYNVR